MADSQTAAMADLLADHMLDLLTALAVDYMADPLAASPADPMADHMTDLEYCLADRIGVLQALVREGMREALRDLANVYRILAKALEGTIRREVWTSPIEATTLLANLRHSEWEVA
uniref:Uncharacterized protein n=1 Tax=Chromera velia CCMP2878 TaxID=1169474 RepID=A0A0G4GN52_9ALVE|eukprot:Cvel_22634.t1-p1 / transcript=Cvel_22634.t1 / gene=Cvel_22634 / organism=Chromera_velia_CCMP2878 / gene_product=hypothetical protein / transcript_product=hypothetical protein / location=Cvel_scaffold2245:23238-26439(+) / protein_length=115 / sequence_SO=supercontig / SO=protein_coding / is_pseudo=false